MILLSSTGHTDRKYAEIRPVSIMIQISSIQDTLVEKYAKKISVSIMILLSSAGHTARKIC